MADPQCGHRQAESADDGAFALDEAIALLETGQASNDIRIDFGGGVYGSVAEAGTLDGLLQRARGVRLIKMMADDMPVERPPHMRKGKPALTPLVQEILDALKPSR